MSWKSRALARAGAHQHLGSQALSGALAGMSLLLLFLSTLALGQSAPPSGQPVSEDQAYRDAIAAAGPGGDVLKLERYASTATGQHRKEALAWLVWTYKEMGDSAMTSKWAHELQSADPTNSLALAMLANGDQQITRTSPGEPGADQPLSLAKQALRGLDSLAQPEGMSDDAFGKLKTDLARSLNGAVGYAYFQRHDYLTARSFLRKAVALAPENAQYTYALALTDLESRNADAAEGFKMLARAVNLTLGSPAGIELAAYARSKYRFAGGTDADWDRFIAATRVTHPPQQSPIDSSPEISAQAKGTSGTTGAAIATQQSSVTPVSPPRATATTRPSTKTTSEVSSAQTVPVQQPSAQSAPTRSTTAPPSTARVPTTQSSNSSQTQATRDVPSLPTEVATVTPLPTLPPRPPMRVFAPDQPVSLGILIETATTSRDTRTNVINALTDMVRRLREHDEAFLVSFSNEVVFEQDLTNNAQFLEQAMDRIKPLQGTALFDAVAFAAGHLKRIAANKNRVLLVISDGSNDKNTISPLELSGEITMSGVKIFCIGLQASTAEDQQRLTALANATGGHAVFLSSTSEFRGAAREVAARLGIPF